MGRYFVVKMPGGTGGNTACTANGLYLPEQIEGGIQPDTWLGVDSLTGCLGLVCIAYPAEGGQATKALAVHDQDPPYLLARKALRAFLTEEALAPLQFSLVYSFGAAEGCLSDHVRSEQATAAAAFEGLAAKFCYRRQIRAKDFFCELSLQHNQQTVVGHKPEEALAATREGASLSRPHQHTVSTTPAKETRRQLNDSDTEAKAKVKRYPPGVYWHKDADHPQCECCNAKFSLVVRRHHCRHCGKVICHNCTKEALVLSFPRTTQKYCTACERSTKPG